MLYPLLFDFVYLIDLCRLNAQHVLYLLDKLSKAPLCLWAIAESISLGAEYY